MYEDVGGGGGCGVVELVKRSTLIWFGHTERIENKEFDKKIYLTSAGGLNRRGRPRGRWVDRVKECARERGVRGNGLEWARREHMDRRSEGLSSTATPLGTLPEGARRQSY